MVLFIRRKELESFLRGSDRRRLLYGRRKTGKTFYVRQVLRDRQYFIVRRGGAFYDPFASVEFELPAFLRICRAGGVIVDEFHRADSRFFDALQAGECGEDLTLITSTLHYFRKFVEGPEAPLLGLFSIKRVGLISPLDLLRHSWDAEVGKELIELLTLYQEPTLIGKGLKDAVLAGKEFTPALLGEVLNEEDITFTRRFHAVLEAVASGKDRLTEIAAYVYSVGQAPTSSTSHIVKYVNALIKIGLLERVEIWGKKRGSRYRHSSPLTDLIYYLHAKYGFFDTPLTWGFIERAVKERMPTLIEHFAERLLTEVYGLKPVKIIEPEIDIALTKFRKVALVAEVKWANKIRREDVRKAEEKLARYPESRKLLIVPDASSTPETWLEVMDVKTMAKLARHVGRRKDQ